MSPKRYIGQLFLTWFNQRHERDFALLPETAPAVGDRRRRPSGAHVLGKPRDPVLDWIQ